MTMRCIGAIVAPFWPSISDPLDITHRPVYSQLIASAAPFWPSISDSLDIAHCLVYSRLITTNSFMESDASVRLLPDSPQPTSTVEVLYGIENTIYASRFREID